MEKYFFKTLLLVKFIALSINMVGQVKKEDDEQAELWAKTKVTQMSIEEKANLLCGSSEYNQLCDDLKASGTSAEISRLGIKPMVVSDGPAGLRILTLRPHDVQTYYSTAFPVGTSLASTWDVDLVQRVGEAMGEEVKEYGVDILLGPGMNIQRSPLCGRNFEYYSEDPYVAGNIAAAMINGIQKNGVGTSLKHFVANNQEQNRHSIDEIISERAMREIYLRGFEIAVKKSNPWTVMSSYNKVDGYFTSDRKDLLTDILRSEWGYKGFVMSDWWGGTVDNYTKSNVIAQISAGNDMLMPGLDSQREDILTAVKSGKLKMGAVDLSCERILKIVYKSISQNNYAYSNNPDLKTHAELTRKAGADGMVLLKNEDNSLPLTSKEKVALFRVASYKPVTGGLGSGDVYEAHTTSLVEGLKNQGIAIDNSLAAYYTAYLNYPYHDSADYNYICENQIDFNNDCLKKLALNNDVAVITIGRISAEGVDRTIKEDYNLKTDEKRMIENVSQIFHTANKKVVVVLNVGGVIETESWKNKVDAILLAWQPGQEVGNSIADVLSGEVNPSGKLTMTFPKAYEDSPAAKYFPGEPVNDPQKSYYKEGIFVGYRGYERDHIEPSFEFGFGMSYTSFTYSDLVISSEIFKDKINVSVKITNNGNSAGKEVVELYLKTPLSTIEKPEKELKGFAKTHLLEPGESQILDFILQPKDLSSFHSKKEEWIADKGMYKVMLGASSKNIKLQDNFKLTRQLIVEKVHPSFQEEAEE